MATPLSRAAVREIDRRAIEEFGVPGVVLMENAGRGAADFLRAEGGSGPRPAVICCGKGNNGGDGFVIARHLDNRGSPVRILLFANPAELTGDAAIMFQIAERSAIPITVAPDHPSEEWLDHHLALSEAGFIVDALFGTGLQGALRSPFDDIVEAINRQDRGMVVAIDIPSGLDCDTGQPLGAAVKARYTVTFVAPKLGFTEQSAANFVGSVRVVDIGVPRVLLSEFESSADNTRPATKR